MLHKQISGTFLLPQPDLGFLNQEGLSFAFSANGITNHQMAVVITNGHIQEYPAFTVALLHFDHI